MHQIILQIFIIVSRCNYSKNISCKIKKLNKLVYLNLFLDLYHLKAIQMLPSLTRSKTQSPSNDIVVCSDCISLNIATNIFTFVFSYVCFQLFTCICFHKSYWILCCLCKHHKNKNIFFYPMQTHFWTTLFEMNAIFESLLLFQRHFQLIYLHLRFQYARKTFIWKIRRRICKYDIKIQSKIIIA